MFYKVLKNGRSFHGGDLEWPLPIQAPDGSWVPGDWVESPDVVKVCSRGLHLTIEPGRWYGWNCDLYVAEGAGESQTKEDKTAFFRARLLRPEPHPDWWIETKTFVDSIPAIGYLNPGAAPIPDGIKIFDIRGAAGDAAWDAARDAAGDAAWDAAGEAAGEAAWDAAWDAARDAAGDAARDAAWGAAGEAAWDAARDAARDATLFARCIIVADKIAAEHIAHARLRMACWEAGLGIYCDVNGMIFAYRSII